MFNISQDTETFESQVKINEEISKSQKEEVVSFCFGPPFKWGLFSIFCVTNSGKIFFIFPFFPKSRLFSFSQFFEKMKKIFY